MAMSARPIETTRGLDLPEGLEVQEIIAFGDRLIIQCKTHGLLVKQDGKYFRVNLLPFKPKVAKEEKPDVTGGGAPPDDAPPASTP